MAMESLFMILVSALVDEPYCLFHRHFRPDRHFADRAFGGVCSNRRPAYLRRHEQIQPDGHSLFYPGRKPDEPGRHRQAAG